MKKIMLFYYCVCFIVGAMAAFLKDTKNLKDLLKTLICAALAGSIVILIGWEYQWSVVKLFAAGIIVSAYARPVIYGINKQIKEFFADPQSYINKFEKKDSKE